jgi:RNA polymerase sigma-70 factor (ECF subfamily)
MPPATSLDLAHLGAHTAWLRRLARTLVRGDGAADDAEQETWLAALTHPRQAEAGGRAWLTTVLRNVVRRRGRGDLRRAKRERHSVAGDDAHAASPEQILERHEQQRLVAAIVSELDEPYRTTILLRYAEGLSPAAIAAREGIPPGTVRWRLKRATEEIRRRLDQRHGGRRRAWALPLASLPEARGGGGALLPGVLAMKIATKVSAGIAVALLLAAGALLVDGRASREGTLAAAPSPGSASARGSSEAQTAGPAPPAAPRPGSHRPGARTSIPKLVVAGTVADDPGTHAAPPRLTPVSGGLIDRRPNPPPGAAELREHITERLRRADVATQACMERWSQVDPSLVDGVMLALTLDERGLDEVWIEDRAEIPSGPLQCLSEGIYQIDWSGLTKEPLKVTRKVRYAASEARGPDGRHSR